MASTLRGKERWRNTKSIARRTTLNKSMTNTPPASLQSKEKGSTKKDARTKTERMARRRREGSCRDYRGG